MKNNYLMGSIFLFIILVIPYFQNIAMDPPIIFFFIHKTFTGLYFPTMFLGILEGALIYKTVQTFIDNVKQKTPDKFDLSK